MRLVAPPLTVSFVIAAVILRAAAAAQDAPAAAPGATGAAATVRALAADPDGGSTGDARHTLEQVGSRLVLLGEDRTVTIPRRGGRARPVRGGDVDDLGGALADGTLIATDLFDAVSGPITGPLRTIPHPDGFPPTRAITGHGGGALTVLQSGSDIVLREPGRADRRVTAGASVDRVVGDKVVLVNGVADDDVTLDVTVRSAADWSLLADSGPVDTGAFDVTPDGAITFARRNGDILRIAPGASAAQLLGRIPAPRDVDRLAVAGGRVVVGGTGLGVLEPDGSTHRTGPPAVVFDLIADGDRVVYRGDGCVVDLDPAAGPIAALPAGGPCAPTQLSFEGGTIVRDELRLDVFCAHASGPACALRLRIDGRLSGPLRVPVGKTQTLGATLGRAPGPFDATRVQLVVPGDAHAPRLTVYPDPPAKLPGGTTCAGVSLDGGDVQGRVSARGTSCATASAVTRALFDAAEGDRVRAAGFACRRYPATRPDDALGQPGGTWRCTRGTATAQITIT